MHPENGCRSFEYTYRENDYKNWNTPRANDGSLRQVPHFARPIRTVVTRILFVRVGSRYRQPPALLIPPRGYNAKTALPKTMIISYWTVNDTFQASWLGGSCDAWIFTYIMYNSKIPPRDTLDPILSMHQCLHHLASAKRYPLNQTCFENKLWGEKKKKITSKIRIFFLQKYLEWDCGKQANIIWSISAMACKRGWW